MFTSQASKIRDKTTVLGKVNTEQGMLISDNLKTCGQKSKQMYKRIVVIPVRLIC